MIIGNVKEKIKNHKKTFIIISIIILLFLITIIAINVHNDKKRKEFIRQETERVRQYSAITDFQNLDEVALYLNCKLIKQQDSKRDNVKYDVYMELPVKVDDENGNYKNFVENLIQFSAYVLKYKNFVIIDEKNQTSILVTCNEEKQLIEKYYINNIENYFELAERKQQINELKANEFKGAEITEFEISSQIINELIANNWKSDKVNFGTQESFYRNYNIYFDEGIEVRVVAGKVFNIVFNNKYQNNIINNLNTKSTIEEIKNSLGKPTFDEGSLIGYKGKDIYAFFYNNQVSIYPVEQYETDEIAKAISEKNVENSNEKVFVDAIKNIWKDYDIYDFDENNVKLQYTLKGLAVKYDSTTKKGVIVYNNYKGKLLRKSDFRGNYK